MQELLCILRPRLLAGHRSGHGFSLSELGDRERYYSHAMMQISFEEGAGPRLCSDLPQLMVGNGRKVDVWDFVALCQKACQAILEVYRLPEEEWKLQHKDGFEPLTKADLDSNKACLWIKL